MTIKQMFDRTFKDHNNKVVIMQWPNIPLLGWIAFKLGALISDNPELTTSYNAISTTFLLVWAVLELTSGVNYFRQMLGLVVLVATLAHYMI
jgi:hypothetical protein